ncbi:uncharacterized protein AMSG_12360 [Thecamonas trahens ATCC 50062]|uniref:Uncharacterized protein n=1 Tax=Thecamonas trahens ATCC 50062 TaxID=461836 RepID=A0A0L0DRD2_THETB|nr:hypothetical protein AMSG_12360 [Thecamonas trahens ATCC 50062]KNC54879.1 hypothetical protein AMSG_12360 [Thecamonas trahens ATCC 50062]|eukprot:XP_013753524.1 hypothetical protein AMSG_12360 [Thecamonas trahens ATCC 50062]
MQGGKSLQRINFDNVGPIASSSLLQFVNGFVLSSVQFLNRFSGVCEEKLGKVAIQLSRLEATMAILEAKLESVPGLDQYNIPIADSDSESDDASPAAHRPNGVRDSTAEESPAPAAPAAAAAPVAAVRLVKDNPKYKKFFLQMRMGVDERNIRNQMMIAGLNPDLITTPNAPDPDVEGALGNEITPVPGSPKRAKKLTSSPEASLDDGETQGLVGMDEVAGGDGSETATFFGTVLAAAGVRLDATPASHGLTAPPAAVRQALKTKLYFDDTAREAFVNSLLEYLDEGPEFLVKALRPMVQVKTTPGSAGLAGTPAASAEPLLRLCLGVEPVQTQLALALLEAIPEHADDSPEVPKLILAAFRWLDTVVDGAAIATKLLELLDAVSNELQRELILFLPEIVDDAAHATVVKALQALMEEKPFLAVPILDTLANLHLEGDLLVVIRAAVLSRLASVPIDEAPIMVKFLLQTSASSAAALGVVIRELRANLDFVSEAAPGASAAASETAVGEALTLEALKAGIRFRPAIARGFLKDITATPLAHMHRGIDLWILFVIASLDSRRKAVKSLLRKKVAACFFTQPLLSAAIVGHSPALKEYVPVMRSLAEELLRSPAPIVASFGAAWYKLLFTEFESPLARQDILASIMTHIGSTSSSEVTAALNVLIDLAAAPTTGRSMRSFVPFFKGMLDYLFTQPNVHVRLLFQLFTLLAVGAPIGAGAPLARSASGANAGAPSSVSSSASSVASGRTPSAGPGTVPWESALRDELLIIIRKHVSNPAAKFKRIGILGAVALIAALAPYTATEPGPPRLDEASLHTEAFSGVRREIVLILSMLKAHTASFPSAYAFMCDEMSALLVRGRLPRDLVFYISSELSSVVFETKFVIDNTAEAMPKPSLGLVPARRLNLDVNAATGESTAEVAIAVLNHQLAPDPAAREVLVGLCSEFRLLHVCERSLQAGSMEEIDAILGCPLVLFDTSALDAFDQLSIAAKDAILLTLFQGINWCRELLNAFAPPASAPSAGTKAKVAARLANMLELTSSLLPLLPLHPVTFPVIGRVMELEDESGAGSSSVTSGKSGSGKGKASKGKSKASASAAAAGSMTVALPPLWLASSGFASLSLFLRELDMSVFSLLSFSAFVVFPLAALDADRAAGMGVSLASQPHLLHVLLSDLLAKIKHMLPARSASGRVGPALPPGFGSAAPSWETAHAFANVDAMGRDAFFGATVALIPALCEHLERLNSFLALDPESLASLAPHLESDAGAAQARAMAAHLLVLLLNIFESLFLYHALVEQGARASLATLLAVPATRIAPHAAVGLGLDSPVASGEGTVAEPEAARLSALVGAAFDYFSNIGAAPASHSLCSPLIALLTALATLEPGSELLARVSTLAGAFLARQWDGEPALRSELIASLLTAYIRESSTPVTIIHEVVTTHIGGFVSTSGDDGEVMPALTKTSLPVFFRVVLTELVANLGVEPLAARESAESIPERLQRVEILVRAFSVLAKATKVFTSRPYLLPILKHGTTFAAKMSKHITALAPCFRIYVGEIQTVVKCMQTSTRILQAICAESKIMDSHKLGRFVPRLRKELETLIFKVKGMLSANNLMSAFWMGNLKHRNLLGEVVSDRIAPEPSDSDSDDEDSDDDEEDDEADDDDE